MQKKTFVWSEAKENKDTKDPRFSVSVPSRYLQNFSPSKDNKTEAVADALSGYVALTLVAYAT